MSAARKRTLAQIQSEERRKQTRKDLDIIRCTVEIPASKRPELLSFSSQLRGQDGAKKPQRNNHKVWQYIRALELGDHFKYEIYSTTYILTLHTIKVIFKSGREHEYETTTRGISNLIDLGFDLHFDRISASKNTNEEKS